MVLSVQNGARQVADVTEKRSDLRVDPVTTLCVEVFGQTSLLFEYHDLVKVVDVDMLTKQQNFQFFVVPGRLGIHDVLLKPSEIESHAGTGGRRRQAEGDMTTAEDGVVDFFEDGAQTGGRRVVVLRYTMGLDHLRTGGFVGFIDLFQKFRLYQTAWVQYDDNIVNLQSRQVVDSQL